MKSNSLLLTCEVLFRFLPFFLDTGLQIWNAVEVDRLASSCDSLILVDGFYKKMENTSKMLLLNLESL